VHRTRIKICGIARREDAQAAVSAGADAIGLLFHSGSKRFVSTDVAKQIVAGLPPMLSVVGLFVDADVDAIRRIVSEIHFAALQLHGNETPQVVAQLKPIPVIKAIRVDAKRLGEDLRVWKSAVADLGLTNLVGLVMETASTKEPGGTGIVNDWQTLSRHIKAGDFKGLPPLIAAGGLTPGNVADVVRMIRPWAVDVSSGVESEPRQKSSDMIQQFVQAVREADRD
jgi:phosphoribosylanthranilate isomerase